MNTPKTPNPHLEAAARALRVIAKNSAVHLMVDVAGLGLGISDALQAAGIPHTHVQRVSHEDGGIWKKIPLTVSQARAALHAKGYSYRRAAVALGCSFTHLSHVLTNRRESRRLLTRIAALPKSPIPFRHSGFATHNQPHP